MYDNFPKLKCTWHIFGDFAAWQDKTWQQNCLQFHFFVISVLHWFWDNDECIASAKQTCAALLRLRNCWVFWLRFLLHFPLLWIWPKQWKNHFGGAESNFQAGFSLCLKQPQIFKRWIVLWIGLCCMHSGHAFSKGLYFHTEGLGCNLCIKSNKRKKSNHRISLLLQMSPLL